MIPTIILKFLKNHNTKTKIKQEYVATLVSFLIPCGWGLSINSLGPYFYSQLKFLWSWTLIYSHPNLIFYVYQEF